MPEIKRMDIKEFREKGFLQEVNRQFFHPIGLALEVMIDENGEEKLGGIWDYSDDPEGLIFSSGEIELEKAAFVEGVFATKAHTRIERFGWVVQPINE